MDPISDYMQASRNNGNIEEVVTTLNGILSWADGIFPETRPEMKGLNWGDLYARFHGNFYEPDKVMAKVDELIADDSVTAKRGIIEYVLGGCVDTKLLHIRLFDNNTKRVVFTRQTEYAKRNGCSNCPMCATSTNEVMRTKLYDYSKMEADHAGPWSKGNPTSIENCVMLCKAHNLAKGNA